MAVRGDYAAGYRAARRIVALGEARGYEPETSQARYVFAVLSCWFGPIEDGLAAARRAREGLIAGGDLVYAGHVYHEAVYYQLECAPSLDVYAAEVEAGLAFLRQTGSEHTGQVLDSHRWLAGVLRGESSAAADGAAVPPRGTPAPRWRFSSRMSRARSPRLSSAILPRWRGIRRRPPAATRPPGPACCAGWRHRW